MQSYANVADALIGEMRMLFEGGTGTQLVAPRDGKHTHERLHAAFTIRHPVQRVLTLPHRNVNPFAQVAETLWVLAGRNDIKWLSHYLPRVNEFSDDGVTWRGGYGPRLRHWKSRANTDQLQAVVRLLQAEPETRRAVVSLWDPERDLGTVTKDIPCNNWLHFIRRGDRLWMSIVARSMDIMWGFSGINHFEWSVLHELVANSVGAEIGPATWFVGSLHIYEHHVKRAKRMLDAVRSSKQDPIVYGRRMDYMAARVENVDQQLDLCFTIEQHAREGRHSRAIAMLGSVRDPFFRECCLLLYVYNGGDPSFLGEIHSLGLQETARRWLEIKNEDAHKLARTDIRVAAASLLQDSPVNLFDGKVIASTPAWVPTETPGVSVSNGALSADVVFQPSASSTAATVAPERHAFDDVAETLKALHDVKDRAYGNSWKRHGELLSIFANISRKIDRLESILIKGIPATGDESAVDTVADLAVYNLKYLGWLAGEHPQDFELWLRSFMPGGATLGMSTRYAEQKGFRLLCALFARLHDLGSPRRPAVFDLETLEACQASWDIHYRGLEVPFVAGQRVDPLTKVRMAAGMAVSAMLWLELARSERSEDYVAWAKQWVRVAVTEEAPVRG